MDSRYGLKQWEVPSDYYGTEFHGYYTTGLSRTFKTSVSLIDTANCKAFLKLFPEYAEEFLFGHWVTDYYAVFVKPETPEEVLKEMQEVLDGLDAYPIISDDVYYELEDEAREWSINRFISDYEREHEVTLNEAQADIVREWFYQYGTVCEDYVYLGSNIEAELEEELVAA